MGKLLDKQAAVEVFDKYYPLVEQFPLKPIRDDKTHAQAVAVVTALAEVDDLNQDQSDYMDVLTDLVADYESQRWPMESRGLTVIDILESFLEDHGMTRDDLGLLLGKDRTLGSKIMNGKRKLTTAQVKILADHFKVSADLFL